MGKASMAGNSDLDNYTRLSAQERFLQDAILRFPVGKTLQATVDTGGYSGGYIGSWNPKINIGDIIRISHTPFFQELTINGKKQKYVRVNFMVFPSNGGTMGLRSYFMMRDDLMLPSFITSATEMDINDVGVTRVLSDTQKKSGRGNELWVCGS